MGCLEALLRFFPENSLVRRNLQRQVDTVLKKAAIGKAQKHAETLVRTLLNFAFSSEDALLCDLKLESDKAHNDQSDSDPDNHFDDANGSSDDNPEKASTETGEPTGQATRVLKVRADSVFLF